MSVTAVSAKARLPMSASISRTIRRRRKVTNREPSLPQHRRDIIIPEEFKVTNDGNNFLLFDSGPIDNRILVFGTIKNLELLAASNVWLADGTFKHVPLLFYQLLQFRLFILYFQTKVRTSTGVYCKHCWKKNLVSVHPPL